MSDDDDNPGSPEKKKRGRQNVITPEVVEAIDVAQLSNSKAAKVLSALSSAVGVPVKETNINRQSIHRLRQKQRDLAATDIRTSFNPDSILTVHWDGKIVGALEGGRKKSDRQAVIVTGISTNQILGAPVVENGGSDEVTRVVLAELEKWRIKPNVRAASFDTTSVNTGLKAGAAMQIERALGRVLVWLPCHHHVFELVLGGVFDEIFGSTSGPEVPVFKELQRKWEKIDFNPAKLSTFSKYVSSLRTFQHCSESIIEFAKTMIEIGQPRDDYLELLELTIIFLEATPPKGIRFRPPGPMHHARWMSKAIYCIKMSLFRKQLELEKGEAEKLLQITNFVVKLYVQGWFLAPQAASAPRNDFNFLKNLLEYESVNKVIARAAQNKFLSHLWYLSEEAIGLAVFDEKLPDEERAKLVSGILTREGEEEPPKKRSLQLRDLPEMCLSDLSTKNTMRFFQTLDIKVEFFSVPVSEWVSRVDYTQGKEIVDHLRVVNDHAERGVKLMTDYNQTVTKDENSFQNLLLTVDSHRKSTPDSTKATLIKKYDGPSTSSS